MIRPLPLPLGFWCLRTSIALGKNCKIWDACASHVTSNCNLSKVEIIYETSIKREVFKTCPLQTGPHPTSIPFLLRCFTPTERISRGSLGVVWNSSWDPPTQKIMRVCPHSNIHKVNINIYKYIHMLPPQRSTFFEIFVIFASAESTGRLTEKEVAGMARMKKQQEFLQVLESNNLAGKGMSEVWLGGDWFGTQEYVHQPGTKN